MTTPRAPAEEAHSIGATRSGEDIDAIVKALGTARRDQPDMKIVRWARGRLGEVASVLAKSRTGPLVSREELAHQALAALGEFVEPELTGEMYGAAVETTYQMVDLFSRTGDLAGARQLANDGAARLAGMAPAEFRPLPNAEEQLQRAAMTQAIKEA